MMRWMLALVGMTGCKGGPATQPEDTDLLWPPPKAFQVDGEAGSIVAMRLDFVETSRVDVYGVFADTTQDFLTAGACAQDAMPCVADLPAELDGIVRSNQRRLSQPDAYRWVGDTVSVGAVQAVAQTDDETGEMVYFGSNESRPVGDQRVRFGGEWADVDLDLVHYSETFEVTGPALEVNERIDLSGGTVTFTWESSGDEEVWLWFAGPTTRRMFILEDDGEFELDVALLDLDPAEVVQVGLAAADRRTLNVAGNDLQVLSLAGSGWKGSACGSFLDLPISGGDPPAEPMEDPFFFGFAFNGIIDDGVHDYYDPETGVLTSANLTFTFYDFAFNPLCTIQYDAGDAARRNDFVIDSDANLYASFDVALFNGESTCGPVTDFVFGYSDLRNYVEQFDWGFAIGDVFELEEPLSEAFGEDWENQSQFMYSVYWTKEGLFGDELGYGYAYELPQCYQGAPSLPYRSPTGDLPPGHYFTFPYFVQPVP